MDKFIIFIIILYIIATTVGILPLFNNAKKHEILIYNDVDKLIEYRKNHPRCRYCKYSYLLNEPKYLNIWIHKCDLKDKIIRFFDWQYRGCFCDYFELENLDD